MFKILGLIRLKSEIETVGNPYRPTREFHPLAAIGIHGGDGCA